MDISKLIEAAQPVDAAKAAIRLGLVPIPLLAIGENGSTDGKRPFRTDWQHSKPALKQIDWDYGKPGRGVGLLLGPRGKLIDIEVDDDDDDAAYRDKAETDLLELCGGEVVETAGWISGRGRHRLFLWNPILDQAAAMLAEFSKEAEDQGKTGRVIGSSAIDIENLEIRLGIGGKGAQSAIPPTKHPQADRQWVGPKEVAMLPDAAALKIVDYFRNECDNRRAIAERAAQAAKNRSARACESGWSLSREEETTRKRIEGFTRSSCNKIKAAPAGDKKGGRYPTARNEAITIAGFVAQYRLHDMTDWCKGMLIDAYLAAKPEAAGTSEEDRPVSAGWAYGLPRPHHFDEREHLKPAVNGATHHVNGHAKPETATAAPQARRVPPSLADVASLIKGFHWVWPGWILSGQITLLTGASGAGKSTVMADIARRVFKGEPWPDGQPQTIEPGKPILWLNSDRRMDQLAELWAINGLPPESCYLAHDPQNPLEPLYLDSAETMSLINDYVDAVKPWAIVIDTVSRATNSDVCDPIGVTAVTAPLLELSNRTGVAVFLLGHTNKDGEAYGRHIKTACQVCWKLEGTSASPNRVLKNDERSPIKPPDPIAATIGDDGVWSWSGGVIAAPDSGPSACADIVMDVIQRRGRVGWSDLLGACALRLGVPEDNLKSTLTRVLKSMVDLGTLIRIEEISKNKKPFKVWDISPESSSQGDSF